MSGVERQDTAPRPTRLGAITPDQIEQRPFPIEDGGYDRDEVRKFLAEVAATLRLAQRSTIPPVLVPLGTPGTATDPTPFDRVPLEVTRVLRAAAVSAQTRRDEAEAFAAAVVERAEHDAEQVRHRAIDEAAAETERARRVLLAAQEQAQAIVTEAERRAGAMLDAAREHARQHARRIAGEAQRRAHEVSEAEGAALLRLNEARLDLVNVIDTLAATRVRTVLDITGPDPEIHIVRRDADDHSPVLELGELPDDAAPAAPTAEPDRSRETGRARETEADDLPVLELVVDDDTTPTSALIRRAVERATAAATSDPEPELDVVGASNARLAPARATPVRQSVKRRQAHTGDARPCPSAVAPSRPAGRATPARRTDG